jgi:putative ABC transport system permease protein
MVMGDSEVESVAPVYIFPAVWKNPWTNSRRTITLLGFHPSDHILDTPGFEEARAGLTAEDTVLFDARSRPEFGAVAQTLRDGGRVSTEVNNRQVQVAGLFEMGTSFGIDGSLLTSDDNFLRLFPDRSRNDIQLGLVTLKPGADPARVRDRLLQWLPKDVLVLTKPEFVARERAYWNRATPVGYVFAFGAIMGLVVGAIIVYQILFADVSEHLHEYATLRAMGYGNGFVSGIVLQQAVILGVLGFLPGMALAAWLYTRASAATSLPLEVTPERAAVVFALTLGMCALSGLLAVRKVRRLDPAEVF